MSLAGAMGGHTVVAKLIAEYGTAEQKDKYLPRMATGELRATMALTEPGGGCYLQAAHGRGQGRRGLRHQRVEDVDHQRPQVRSTALLCNTDPSAEPRHKGISIILVEKGEGFTVSKNLSKLGYKGVETCELVSAALAAVPAARLGRGRGLQTDDEGPGRLAASRWLSLPWRRAGRGQ